MIGGVMLCFLKYKFSMEGKNKSEDSVLENKRMYLFDIY